MTTILAEREPRYGDTVILTAPNIKQYRHSDNEGVSKETKLIGRIINEEVRHNMAGSSGPIRSVEVEITLEPNKNPQNTDEEPQAMRLSNIPLAWVKVLRPSEDVDIPRALSEEMFRRVALTLPGMWTVEGERPIIVTYKETNAEGRVEWKTWKKEARPVKTFRVGEK